MTIMQNLRSRYLPATVTMVLLACSGARCAEPVSTSTDKADLAVLQRQLQDLQTRTERVKDSNALKKLQRAYGYYVDKGQWDEAANLFSDDATLELARDGVYRSKDHIRKYFYALGDGKQGLAHGRLYENLLVMPVVTLGDDGKTAKGRWRDIMLNGQFGQHAEWGEGPFEAEYVKHDGVWKISKLVWQQMFLTAYAGGWVKNEDFNKGIWVSDKLKPDAPPTADHGWWPQTWLLPFHFSNPVLNAARAAAPKPNPKSGATDLKPLAAQTQGLQAEIGNLEAENDIENLQGIFGFYYDKYQWQQAADLFTDDATFEWGGSGVYVGKQHILAYLNSLGKTGPLDGVLNDQMQLQPIVTVASDGNSAKGRWHLFSQEAVHGQSDAWGTGVYENEYRRENGVWKLSKLKLYTTMKTPYADGWGKTALPRSKPSTTLPPDRPPSTAYDNYPAVFVPPFHYGNPAKAPAPAAKMEARTALADVAAVAEALAALDKRTGLLEDADAVERLHTVYGYYLANYKMDDLAGLFTDDGTIEIALRGVYKGKASVRRNLDLYGPLDLHNHMQFQPVIHIAQDGQSALMRSRAFSIMGSHGGSGTFMGGTYENLFVKRNGVWMLQIDHQINTYFANYDVGWKDAVWRAAPGISKDNPPDAPPSVQFEMYPRAFLQPYHYKNPVTGQ